MTQLRLFPTAMGRGFEFLASKIFFQRDQEKFKLNMTQLRLFPAAVERVFIILASKLFPRRSKNNSKCTIYDISQQPWEKYFVKLRVKHEM